MATSPLTLARSAIPGFATTADGSRAAPILAKVPDVALPPAGYYPDPDDPGRQRWWDGHDWATPATGARSAAPPPPIVHREVPEPNAYAITSLVLSISWIFFLGSLLGVIFGHLALRRIRESEGQETGRGTALVGLVVGYAGLIAGLFLIVLLTA
jgi:hypothetical protein